MDAATRKTIIAELDASFGGAVDRTPADGQPAHVLLTKVKLPRGWSPSPTRAMVVFTGWPGQRPDFYIDISVRDTQSNPPRNNGGNLQAASSVLGESWQAFSFPFTWPNGTKTPTRAVQLWLGRFRFPG